MVECFEKTFCLCTTVLQCRGLATKECVPLAWGIFHKCKTRSLHEQKVPVARRVHSTMKDCFCSRGWYCASGRKVQDLSPTEYFLCYCSQEDPNHICSTRKKKALTYLAPDLNSFIMDSLSFWGMSPCIDETVKLASLIFSVSQSTWAKEKPGLVSFAQQLKQCRKKLVLF